MHVLLVFNPAARGNYDGRTESQEAWERDPFEGIEVLGLCATEAEVARLIRANDAPGLKFHYEEIGKRRATGYRPNG